MVTSKRAAAIACMRGGDAYPDLCGTVRFLPCKSRTLVIAEISGLPAADTSFFAFHIHDGGNCSGPDFASASSHYNPDSQDHPLHAGDLPPLLSCGSSAYLAAMTDRFRIDDVIGWTVVIHSGSDDFRTQPAGSAGKKIACGVIRRIYSGNGLGIYFEMLGHLLQELTTLSNAAAAFILVCEVSLEKDIFYEMHSKFCTCIRCIRLCSVIFLSIP